MAESSPPDPAVIEQCIARFREEGHNIHVFGKSVYQFFDEHPNLRTGDQPDIHSCKYRLKDEEHLREKIRRKKVSEGKDIIADTLLKEITDLVGVRVLHLHTEQFAAIHNVIEEHCAQGHWCHQEPPKAYTWDPESRGYFEDLGLETLVKESYYTSIHYVVKPNEAMDISCEIQVRTLFEEIWGEIDHVLNYPEPTGSVACGEQLRVLSRLVGAGSRLGDAIFRSHGEYLESKTPAGG